MKTDSQIDTQSDALQFDQAGNPQWELNSETATYPVELDRGGSKTALLAIRLSHYDRAELRSVLKKQQTGFRRDRGKDIVLVQQDYHEFFELFDKHFVLIVDGTNVTDRAMQVKHLDKQIQIKTIAVRDGWGGSRIAPPDEAEEIDPLIQAETIPIRIEQNLWNFEAKRVERVEMTHVMASPKQSWYQRAQSASSQVPSRSGIDFRTNYESIERLYDEIVDSLERVVIKGDRCEQVNRAIWLPKIPLWHKILVVTELARETRAKN